MVRFDQSLELNPSAEMDGPVRKNYKPLVVCHPVAERKRESQRERDIYKHTFTHMHAFTYIYRQREKRERESHSGMKSPSRTQRRGGVSDYEIIIFFI